MIIEITTYIYIYIHFFLSLSPLSVEQIAEMNDFLGEENHLKFRFKFESTPFFQCGLHGLNQAYSGPLPYTRDGLIFLVTKGQYFPGEHTPLALLWKVCGCPRIYISKAVNEHSRH